MSAGLSLVLSASLPVGAAPAYAQPGGAVESPEYREAVKAAVAEYDARNFAEARALFARAHAISPTARTLRGLGITEYELRNYRASASYLEQALSSSQRPLEGELRTETQQLLERARGFLVELRLELQPPQAEVLIDGVSMDRAPGDDFVLDVGDHVLEVRAQGYAPERRALSIQGGPPQSLKVQLRALDAPPVPAPASAAAVRTDSVRERHLGPWLTVGGSSALVATGVVLLGVAAGDIAEVEDAKRGTQWASVQDAHERAPVLSAAGFALLGAGVVGIGAGLLWRFLRPARHERAPQLSSRGGRLLLGGRF